MPLSTPGRRWQPAYRSFARASVGKRLLVGFEQLVKGPIFGCRQCGNCLLQETAFICPMACPKGLRNGPCGGSTPERCYVDTSRPCIWYRIHERAFKMGREERLLEVLPPVDWEKVGGETWRDVVGSLRKAGVRKVFSGLLFGDARARHEAWESVFRPIRQPEWWGGDSLYHPPAFTEPVSALERSLRAGRFTVACEIQPPLSASTKKLAENIELVRPFVTAINFTDNASSTPRMSSWACSALAVASGAEAVMQIAARDRTRAGLQSEIVGASALGVRNVLCVTGDSAVLAPRPRGRMDINDMDSVQMLWILRRMRDEGHYLDGRELKVPPKFFLGAAASPYASDPRFQALRERKKVDAGAQFFQTNLIFDVDRVETWLNELAKREVLDKVYILAGLCPLKSAKMAHYLAGVPGVSIPKPVLDRMDAAEASGGAAEEGLAISLEVIGRIRKLQGIHGLHIMPVGWEAIVPRLVVEAGLPLPLGEGPAAD